MAEVLPSDELTEEPSDFGSLRPGTRLGRYELLVPIARGGMARVWAARQHGQRGFQKLVAIKTILPHLAEEPEFERMFLDEARIASGVHHPNVCEIYELGEDKRTLYLAMEWVSGDSLSRVLRASGKTEALDARIVARIVADACAGVHAAHELTDDDGRQLGVVHRDMSPHNVLLTGDGVAKVCDFGVAKALGQLHEQTSAGQLKGKISYMSPEQVTGAPTDRRSDVFSLGCVLYETTTGVRPFKGERDHMIMHAILSGEVEPPTSIIRSYPPELERIVLRALAQKPILRYPTAERMRFALEEFLTKGQLVTQANVAQVLRARLGDQLDRRRERIKQASSVAEQGGWDPAHAGSTRDALDHRSGVKPSRPSTHLMPPLAREIAPPPPRMTPSPFGAVQPPTVQPATSIAPPAITMPLEGVGGDPAVHGHGLPVSAPTIPHAPAARGALDAPSAPGQPTHTLPIVGGGIMSPFHSSGPPPSQEQSSPGRAADWSRPGRGAEWSSPGHVPVPIHAPHSIPPASGNTSNNPYGNTAIYDVANSLPSEGIAEAQQPQAGAGQYALAALIGLLFAVLIGGGGFFVWRSRTAQPPAPASAMSAPPVTVTAPVASSSPAPPVLAPAASPDIVLRTTPAYAVLLLDGKELPAEARSIPRPSAGQNVTVLIRAKGHEDTSVLVDYFTTSPLDVTLKPVLEIDAPDPAASASASPATSASGASSSKPHTKPRPKDPTVLPDNPY